MEPRTGTPLDDISDEQIVAGLGARFGKISEGEQR